MSMYFDEPNTAPDLDDEDADLSAADRGDTPADAAADNEVDEEAVAAAAAAEAAEAAEAAAEAAAAGDEEEEDEEGDGKNLALRLNKMKAQRDHERAEKADLAARLAALEAGSKPAKTESEVDPIEAIEAELGTLYEQVEEARADGDTKAAAALQRQIDSKNRDISRMEAEYVSATTTALSRENAAYDSLLDAYEADIPAINPKHADFNPEAVRALEFYVAAHEKMGMKPVKALAAARKVVFGAAAPPDAAPAAAAKPAAKPAVKPVDVNKVLDTTRRQPADTSNLGVHKDDVVIDPDNLTDKEWDALPDSKKASMRGDMG